jgi:uncharacterized membrane protein
MRSKARLFGHPLHQMLVVFPLGLLATAVVFDLIYLANGNQTMAVVAYWLIAAGLIGAVVATVPGAIDWVAIPEGTRAKRIGALHGGGNIVVAGLFTVSLLARDQAYQPDLAQMVWSFAGAALALVTAWLGGELVDRLGVGVDDDAHLDASSSLRSGREPHRAS